MAAVDKSITAQFSQLQQTTKPISPSEGAWTPTLTSDGGVLNFAVIQRSGYYQKIGNVCHINFVFKGTTNNSGSESGNLLIGGLPFPVVSNFSGTKPCAIGSANSTTDSVDSIAAWSPGSVLRIVHNNSFVQVSVVGNNSNFDLVGSLTYFTAEL
jgi:hypothetical protein